MGPAPGGGEGGAPHSPAPGPHLQLDLLQLRTERLHLPLQGLDLHVPGDTWPSVSGDHSSTPAGGARALTSPVILQGAIRGSERLLKEVSHHLPHKHGDPRPRPQALRARGGRGQGTPNRKWGNLTAGSPAGGPVLISMRFSGSSSSGASSGITTTGLMCSASAEARRKLGGPWGRGNEWEVLEALEGAPVSHPQSPSAQSGKKAAAKGGGGGEGEDRYLRQPGDLDEPLEVEHVRGSAEEVSEAVGRGWGGR